MALRALPTSDDNGCCPGPEQWALEQFGKLDLGDQRRNARAVRIASAMAQQPDASIPQQMGDSHQAKAAYRFFSRSDLVTFDALSGQHHQQTRSSMQALSRVLLICDGTEVNFTHHPATRGLSPIGDFKGRGFSLHSVMAVDERRQIVGLAHQELFYRVPAVRGESRWQCVRRDRETLVWAKGIEAIGSPPEGSQYIFLGDRAADHWGFYAACGQHGSDWLIRAYHNRGAALGHDAEASSGMLLDLLRTLPALGGQTIEIRGHAQQATRRAKLQVSAGAMSIFVPAILRGQEVPRSVRLWAIRVWECEAPPGVEPLEWTLVTSVPTQSLEEALERAQWYAWRWLIEEYHKCLKTGCAIEERQLEESDRLEALLGMAVVLAVRLLQLKQHVQSRPQTPATTQIDALTLRVLALRRKLKKPPAALSLHEFWRETAKLGGFLGRKSDGEPGWQTLWKGWRELQLLVEGASLFLADGKCG